MPLKGPRRICPGLAVPPHPCKHSEASARATRPTGSRFATTGPVDEDDRYHNSRRDRLTLACNGKQACVIWAGVGGSRRAWRTCAFCECARQHVGAGWTLAALAFAQREACRSRPAIAATSHSPGQTQTAALTNKGQAVLARFELTPAAPLDESQKLGAVVGALLLGHESSHQRAAGLTTPPGQREPRERLRRQMPAPARRQGSRHAIQETPYSPRAGLVGRAPRSSRGPAERMTPSSP